MSGIKLYFRSRHFSFMQNLTVFILALFLTKVVLGQENGLVLKYDKPAEVWTEALPIGNSYMGAMIFGDPHLEHLQLNESSLYSGDPYRKYQGFNIMENYPEIIDSINKGQYEEGEQLIRKHWLGRPQDLYQPMCDLWIKLDHEGKATNYQRSLDIGNALHHVVYEIGETKYHREVFASYPDHVIVLRLRSEGPVLLNGAIKLTTLHEPTVHIDGRDKSIFLDAQVPGFALRRTLEQVEENGEQHKYPEIYNRDGSRKAHAKQILYHDEVDGLGMYFQTHLQVENQGGVVFYEEMQLHFKEVKELFIYLTSATSFTHFRKSPLNRNLPGKRNRRRLAGINHLNYQDLRSRHVRDYHNLFNRVHLSINERGEAAEKTTDRRIMEYGNRDDQDLVTLFFQYGRYLMISGSRPGGQPLNLQGIWNHQLIPPWASAYTTNINLQMNYWPSELTNLSECHEPLFRAIKEWSVDGQMVAQSMYGSPGWVFHHNSSIWRNAGPVDLCPCSFWPVGAGWLVSHLWEHFLFTGDKKFLRSELFPLLKGVVLFYKNWLVPNSEGYLVTPVGHSPEQSFQYGDAKSATLSPGPTMDMALIRESFTRYRQALTILGLEDTELRTEIEEKSSKLLPYQIGKFGQLQEWQFDFSDKDVHHRHLSHLYGFHPGNQITPTSNNELARAVKQVPTTSWRSGNWVVNGMEGQYVGSTF